MRRAILFIGVVVIFSTVSFAQSKNDSIQRLQKQVVNLETFNSRLSAQISSANSNIRNLESKLSSTVDSIDILKKELALTNNNLKEIENKLESQIQQMKDKSNSDFSVLSKRVSNNTIYWIMAIVAIGLFFAILFDWLRTRLALVKAELSDQIKSTSGSIREDILKLDNQLFWSLDLQKKSNQTEQHESEYVDHSVALKVANEIMRIQKNLSSIDPDTKGLKQLEFAVDRIQDSFREKGYEMVDLLNKPYIAGMNITAKFKPVDTLKPGQQIITRIIKPQVNFNSVIIQQAEVEVSVYEKRVGSLLERS